MATVEERYEAATAYVRQAIRIVETGPTVFDPFAAVIEAYAAGVKTDPIRNELSRIDARWMRAANDIDRAGVARDAELLADRAQESLPGAPQNRKRTNLFPGEEQKATPPTSFDDELRHEAREKWSWLKTTASDTAEGVGRFGKWLIVGGGVLLGLQVVDYFKRRERRNGPTRRSINERLARAAERNAAFASGMCPICHRYKFTDARGRLVTHEYPSGGMCPGSGKLPLATDEPTPRRRRPKVSR